MLNAFEAWRYGAHRLTERQVEKLGRTKPKGRLVQVIPSLEDKPSLKSLPNFLIPLHSYKKHACFEIWLHQNRISFYIFAREEKLLEEIKAQLNALYPNALFRDAESAFIPSVAGSFVCGATLSLEYYYCEVKRVQDFDYDPLTHLIESLDVNAVLQIAFKAEAISSRLLERLIEFLKEWIKEVKMNKAALRVKAKSKLPTLYKKVLEAFVEYSIDRKLKFKQARHILSWLFHISKDECWKVLKELESLGAIAIVSNHYLKLNLTKAELFFLKLQR